MRSPLWIDVHEPDLADLPQADLRGYLRRAGAEPINLVLHGPPGVGKTAAARALARAAFVNPETDLIEINVDDFFSMTKTELTNDPRFEHFLTGRSDLSKAAMINHVVKEQASYPPVAGTYKTLLLDNAEAAREDFQQALRRVMERHHGATQFVLTTRRLTALIPPITSRCLPVPVRAPTDAETVGVLEGIVAAEGVEADPAGLEYIAQAADGDLRSAVLQAQTVAEAAGEITAETAYGTLREVGIDDRVADLLAAAADGEFADARSALDDLLVDDGYGGREVLEAVLRVARSRDFGDRAALARTAGEIDFDLARGTNDRLHLSHLLARLGAE